MSESRTPRPWPRCTPGRFAQAIITGVIWGWCLSALLTGWLWWHHGYTVALNRLSSMLAAEHDAMQPWLASSWSRMLLALWHRWLTPWHHLVRWARTVWPQGTPGNPHGWMHAIVGSALTSVKPVSQHSLTLAGHITLVIAGKLGFICLALPLWGWCGLLGLIDGLAQREIRMAEWGRESSFLFHRCVGLVPPLMACLLIAYLVLPIWGQPMVGFGLMGGGIFVMTGLTVSKFKKYV